MKAVDVEKFDFIESLRGVAIIGVVLVHTWEGVKPPENIITVFANLGGLGVQLFFILSALTLCLSMEKRNSIEKSPTRNFFIRRFFRIAPMFYLAIILYLLIDGFAQRFWAPNGIKWWFIPLTFLFINGWHPETINSIVLGEWSIAVEVSFYIVLPILFNYLRNIKVTTLFILFSIGIGWLLTQLIVSLYMPYYPKSQQSLVSSFGYLNFFHQIPYFGIGILLFQLIKINNHKRNTKLGLIFIFFSFVQMTVLTYFTMVHGEFPQILIGFVFGFLIFGLYLYKMPILVNSFTKWTGKLSFSIYLIHLAIWNLVTWLLPNDFHFSGTIGMFLLFGMIFLLSFCISYITYNLIELPGIQLGKMIIVKLEAKTD